MIRRRLGGSSFAARPRVSILIPGCTTSRCAPSGMTRSSIWRWRRASWSGASGGTARSSSTSTIPASSSGATRIPGSRSLPSPRCPSSAESPAEGRSITTAAISIGASSFPVPPTIGTRSWARRERLAQARRRDRVGPEGRALRRGRRPVEGLQAFRAPRAGSPPRECCTTARSSSTPTWRGWPPASAESRRNRRRALPSVRSASANLSSIVPGLSVNDAALATSPRALGRRTRGGRELRREGLRRGRPRAAWRSWEWTWGSTPAFSLELRWSGGRARLEVKGGIVASVSGPGSERISGIAGRRFGYEMPAAAIAALEGLGAPLINA